MAVGIGQQRPRPEAEAGPGARRRARRGGGAGAAPEGPDHRLDVVRLEDSLPVDEVVRPDVGGPRAPIAGSQVLEELDPRAAAGRPERGDPEASPEDLVQVLLLGAGVLALPGHPEPEPIAVAA